ncbi:hypothetical protein ABPG73_011342 [Tetrahymena malaccensis]
MIKTFKSSKNGEPHIQKYEEKILKLEICQICFNDYSEKNVCCKECLLCPTCLDNWFSQQIKDQISDPQSNLLNIRIFCPSCLKEVSIQLIKKYQNMFSNSIDTLTYFSLKKDDSYIVCPSATCKNIGWISNKYCRTNFNCTACNYQWQNPNRISLSKMILQIFGKDFKSRVFKFLFTKNCPHCNTCIQKDGGCKYMTCAKCKKSFCWNCRLANSIFNPICFLISLLKALMILLPLNLILYSCNFYGYLFSSLENYFSLYNLVFKFGYLDIFYYLFRCFYKVALVKIFFIIYTTRQKFSDSPLYYYLNRGIEIFCTLMFGFQVLVFIFFQEK